MISADQMPREWKGWQGQIVNNRFELGQLLGEAPDSAVFLTTLDSSGRKGVIKLVVKADAEVADTLARWKSIKALAHPNLIQIFDAGPCALGEQAFLYAAMEYADENLSSVLSSRALTPAEAREMLDPALAGLAYIHSQGFAHGHIKPSNILALGEQLKLSSDSISPVGTLPGAASGPYSPPEAASDGISKAGDVWSLGATLVEALTGHAWKPAPMQEILLAIPPPFRAIAEHSLRPDPSQRYTIPDIQKQLHGAGEADGQETILEKEGRNRRSLFTPIAIGLLIAAVLIAALVFSRRKSNLESTAIATQAQVSAPAPTPAETRPIPTPGETSSRSQSPQRDAPARVTGRVMADVSRNALRTVHGTVRVKVRVFADSEGNVEKAQMESHGGSRYFANKSLEASKQWKFQPPVKDGKQMASQWDIEFEFSNRSSYAREKQIHP